jgi:hypothetical protein
MTRIPPPTPSQPRRHEGTKARRHRSFKPRRARRRLTGTFRWGGYKTLPYESSDQQSVTLSEGVRRPSRRVPRGLDDRFSCGVALNFGGFFDSLRSLRMTGLGFPPHSMRSRPPRDLFNKRESASSASPRRSRCTPSTAAVGLGWRDESSLSERQHDSTVAEVEDRSRLRRPRTQIRVIREIRVPFAMCDAFVCDVFVSSGFAQGLRRDKSCLCGCDVAMVRCFASFAPSR